MMYPFDTNCEVKEGESRNPKIKIIGIEEQVEEKSIIGQIKKQNEFISGSEMKLIKINKDVRNKFNVIIELDNKSYTKIMKEGKLNVFWNRCRVVNHVGIMRCYKCNGYNHTKEKCKSSTACGKCSGEHETKDCDSNVKMCINCKTLSKKFNLELDLDHYVWEYKCEVLRRKTRALSERIDYGTE